jgi:hypothetical protein
MHFVKLSFLTQILNIYIISLSCVAFQTDIPKYKTIGMWNLKGTSCLKYQDKNINLQIIPKTNCKNLKINWIKQDTFGPLILKNNLEGTICCNKTKNKKFDNKKYVYSYNFKPKKYFISITNIIGINIPFFINFEKNLEERFTVDNIKWDLHYDLLFIEINEEHFIFSRGSLYTNIPSIRLDHFIVSQILGYLLFKLIDKLHLL